MNATNSQTTDTVNAKQTRNSMLTLQDMQTVMRVTMERDPDMAAYLKRMVDVLGRLRPDKYEQVIWVTDLNKWYDMILHPVAAQVQPSIEMVESGKAAGRFVMHVTEVIYWMNEYSRKNGEVPMSREVALDKIDTIDKWLKKNQLKGLYSPIREMLDEAKKRVNASIEVAKMMK